MHGNNLKHYRQQIKGMTQAKLAAISGTGERYYQSLEYGKSEPGVFLAIRLAKALGVSVEALYPLPGEKACRNS